MLHKTTGDRAFPAAAESVWNMLPPAITVTAVTADFQACIEDGTVSQIIRQRTLPATAALTLA